MWNSFLVPFALQNFSRFPGNSVVPEQALKLMLIDLFHSSQDSKIAPRKQRSIAIVEQWVFSTCCLVHKIDRTKLISSSSSYDNRYECEKYYANEGLPDPAPAPANPELLCRERASACLPLDSVHEFSAYKDVHCAICVVDNNSLIVNKVGESSVSIFSIRNDWQKCMKAIGCCTV